MDLKSRLAAGAVMAVGACLVSGLGGAAPAGAAAADDDPPSIVEDFSYPGAAAIEAAHPGVRLITGDGHILFRECATAPASGAGWIRVEVGEDLEICFDVLGPSGTLTMSVPEVVAIDARHASVAGAHAASATIQSTGQAAKQTVLDLAHTNQFGKGVGDNQPSATLLGLSVSPS